MRHITFVLAMIMLLTSCGSRKQADAIYYNAVIYTVDSVMSKAEAMAIKDGRVLKTGSERELRKEFRASEWINLEGKTVYPGFFDAHCHFYGYGLGLQYADLRGTHSQEEIIDRLKEKQKTHPTEWIMGRGWDQNLWKNTAFPDKALLDKAFPDKPVWLERIDGHAYFVNSRVLGLAGITSKTRIEGGTVLLNAKGEPSGVLIDNAMELINPILPKPDSATNTRALLEAQQNCLAVGLTCVADAGLDASTISLISRLQEENKLKLRYYAMISPSEENIEKHLLNGPFNNGRLVISSVKLYADGALGSRGALLIKPYSDDPGSQGLLLHPPALYERICSLAVQHGYQVNVHCIGDSANRMILHIFAKFLQGKNDRRWRIEHAQVIAPEDFHLFGDYSIIPSVQTTHATSDMNWAGERLGPVRVKDAYAYQQLLQQNGWLPNGSDFPVEKINPILGFYAAFSRKDLEGKPEGGFQSENALTREQALRAMTIWAAKACFLEKTTGSLEPGKAADFVVADRDMMTTAESQVPATLILQTVIGGKVVYRK